MILGAVKFCRIMQRIVIANEHSECGNLQESLVIPQWGLPRPLRGSQRHRWLDTLFTLSTSFDYSHNLSTIIIHTNGPAGAKKHHRIGNST